MSKFNFVNKLRKMPITPRKKIWFIISSCIIGLGIIFATIFSILGLGPFNLGLDFTGGTILDINLVTHMNDDNYDDIRDILTDTLDKAGLNYSSPQRSNTTITIRFKDEIKGQVATPDQMTEIRNNLTSNVPLDSSVGYESLYIQLETFLGNDIPAPSSLFTYDAVAATSSIDSWLNALYCVLIASAFILVYIAIRFKLHTGIASVIALFHDILIMFAAMAIFRVQLNAPFIAALITIVGYSINNTIVVFDRMRENSKKISYESLSPCDMADMSIRQTFIRSLNTSITTILTTVLLFAIGVPSIREFTLPIIVGLIAGTYSSIFIAPSIWTIFSQHKINKDSSKDMYKGKKKKEKNKTAAITE